MTLDLDAYRRVHFVGIGGIGMSALARLLVARGHEVSGSEREMGEQAEALTALGVRVCLGHRPAHVDGAGLVVATSAVRDDNPEIQAAREAGIPVIKRAELLAAFTNPRYGVAVAGTHGKTTTTALIGHMLTQAGFDPTVLVGGVSPDLGSNARVGADTVVVEADEYDASFLRLRPRIAVITNVEPDHLDFYGSVERIHAAFRQFAGTVSDTLVVCADDPVLADLVAGTRADRVTYGLRTGDWRADELRESNGALCFRVRHDTVEHHYSTRLAGRHNVLNCLAALATVNVLGVPPRTAAEALASFRGVQRRLEIKGEVGGVLVMDDYAHHPTEVRTVLAAVKDRFHRPVRLVFQPHTYTRTRSLLPDFARSFGDAEVVYLLDIYAARETDTLGLRGQDLAEAAARHHPSVRFTGTADATLAALRKDARPGDLILTMGAGDVYQLGSALLDRWQS